MQRPIRVFDKLFSHMADIVFSLILGLTPSEVNSVPISLYGI
jgi:hypothetical protein